MITFKQFLETYQEEPGGSFTHDGKKYDLNKLFKLAEHEPLAYFYVDDLAWIVTDEDCADGRVEGADVNVPILVTMWEDKWVVLDGLHRLIRAIQLGQSHLPGQVITPDQLKEIEL